MKNTRISQGEVDIDEDEVSNTIEENLVARSSELQVDIFDFDLSKFETEISKQVAYTTQFADKMSSEIKSPNLPPELQKVKQS